MQKKIVALIILFELIILFGFWMYSRQIYQTYQAQHVWHYEGKTTREVQKNLSSCPATSPHLVGPLHVEFNYSRTMEDVRTNLSSTLLEGGRYKPPDCISHHRVSKLMKKISVLRCCF